MRFSPARVAKHDIFPATAPLHEIRMPSKQLTFAIAALFCVLSAQAADITASRQTAASQAARAGEAEFRAL